MLSSTTTAMKTVREILATRERRAFVQVRRKTREILDQHDKDAGRVRIAAQFPPNPLPPEGSGGTFGKGGGLNHEAPGNMKRLIPEGYEFDPCSLKPLAKMLWSMSVALGHALTANRQFTRVKSATISPDGMIGGRGYMMSVKDIRKALYDACEAMSAICDTIHDEVNAPHWKPKLAQLEKDDISDIEHLLGDVDTILEDPEGQAEEMVEDEEEGKNKGAPWHHPAVNKENKSKKDPRSQIPGAGDKETLPSQGPNPAGNDHPYNRQMKQASVELGLSSRVLERYKRANSSLPVQALPGGPRVDHLDRGDDNQTGPFGSYNQDEPISTHDQWSRDQGVGGEYNYPSDWAGDLSDKAATSAVPDANTEPTPTEGYDYGIGRGSGNDAHGQGAGGYGLANPGAPDDDPGTGVGNKGVYGPQSGMPHDPGAPTHDTAESDSAARVENQVGFRGFPRTAEDWTANSELPQDAAGTPARADYSTEWKSDNMMNIGATHLPGEQIPAKDAPSEARPSHVGEHMFAQGMLPGDQEGVTNEFDKNLGPNTSYRYERTRQPYVKLDHATRQLRPDPTYQRDPIQGPYVKQETVRPSDG